MRHKKADIPYNGLSRGERRGQEFSISSQKARIKRKSINRTDKFKK